MIEIDGSYGEGGGQILRNATALSILTNRAIEVSNIRAKRPNPGLRAQHLTALKVLQAISNAEVEGLKIGSSKIYFNPGEMSGGEYKFDIGTAGSVTLVLQSLFLSSFVLPKDVHLIIRGGTDVKWSPSWDYFTRVFCKLISSMRIKVETRLIRRGFYPIGGGEVEIKIYPCRDPKPFQIEEPQDYREIHGNIAISKLPEHISTRIKHAIAKHFISTPTEITIERDGYSQGVVVTLWSGTQKTVVGSTMLGERGLPSEKLGKECGAMLLQEMRSGASLDIYATDQVLAYMAFVASEKKDVSIFLTREISNHARTTMWLIEKFLPVGFEIKKMDRLLRVEVKPL